jgi:hypothetical protein
MDQRRSDMATNRDELRDHLAAVIEAAHELPKEDRSFLADSFLDELEVRYQLVPRGSAVERSEVSPARSRSTGFPLGWWPVPIGLMFVLPLLIVATLLSLFVLVHPPIFLLALILFVLFRFSRPGWRRGRPWGRGPWGRNMSQRYL